MDPAQLLCQRERQLATEYGADHPHRAFDGEDLRSEERSDVEHWVAVYGELVDFMHGLIESASEGLGEAGSQRYGALPKSLRGMTLQARLLELHLAYWTDRLQRLSASTASEPHRPG